MSKTITIVMTRDQLIARLGEQMKIAKRVDAEHLAEHRRRAAEATKAFKQLLREALKWDAATAERRGFGVELPWEQRRELGCPIAQAPRFQRALDALALDRRKDFRIGPSSDLHDLVTWDPQPKNETVCR